MPTRDEAHEIAQQYATAHAEAGRFPVGVHAVLTRAGWFPGRNVADTMTAWREQNAATLAEFPPSDPARRALDEFGGLEMAPGGGLHRTLFYPIAGGVMSSRVHGFVEEYEDEKTFAGPAFPRAVHENGPSEVVMDPAGRVFLLHWGQDHFLGHGIDEALTMLLQEFEYRPEVDGFSPPDPA